MAVSAVHQTPHWANTNFPDLSVASKVTSFASNPISHFSLATSPSFLANTAKQLFCQYGQAESTNLFDEVLPFLFKLQYTAPTKEIP